MTHTINLKVSVSLRKFRSKLNQYSAPHPPWVYLYRTQENSNKETNFYKQVTQNNMSRKYTLKFFIVKVIINIILHSLNKGTV